jgi:NitT/TauT family transport system permease protein
MNAAAATIAIEPVVPRAPAVVTRAGFLALLLLVWEVIGRLDILPDYSFPIPSQVAKSLYFMITDGSLPRALGISLLRLGASYAASIGIGLVVGLALARSRLVEATVGTLVLGLQAMPSICWLPFAVLWFGLSEVAIAYVVIIGSAMAIALGTENAIRNLPPHYVRAARTMGLSGLRLWWRVILPAAFPELLGSARMGWTFAFRSLMAAELLYVSGGLGQVLSTARDLHDVAGMTAIMGVIIALGLVAERFVFDVARAEVRRRWGTDRA